SEFASTWPTKKRCSDTSRTCACRSSEFRCALGEGPARMPRVRTERRVVSQRPTENDAPPEDLPSISEESYERLTLEDGRLSSRTLQSLSLPRKRHSPLLLVRYSWMDFAARRPAPMARITVALPVTISPPANTPFREVCCEAGSASMYPLLSVFRPGVVLWITGLAL